MSSLIRAAMRMVKLPTRFQITAIIHRMEVNELACDNEQSFAVSFIRNNKQQSTAFVGWEKGQITWNQSLSLVSTLYRNKQGKFQEKIYHFVIRSIPGNKVIASFKIDVAQYASVDGNEKELILPVEKCIDGSANLFIKLEYRWLPDAKGGTSSIGSDSIQSLQAEQDLSGFPGHKVLDSPIDLKKQQKEFEIQALESQLKIEELTNEVEQLRIQLNQEKEKKEKCIAEDCSHHLASIDELKNKQDQTESDDLQDNKVFLNENTFTSHKKVQVYSMEHQLKELEQEKSSLKMELKLNEEKTGHLQEDLQSSIGQINKLTKTLNEMEIANEELKDTNQQLVKELENEKEKQSNEHSKEHFIELLARIQDMESEKMQFLTRIKTLEDENKSLLEYRTEYEKKKQSEVSLNKQLTMDLSLLKEQWTNLFESNAIAQEEILIWKVQIHDLKFTLHHHSITKQQQELQELQYKQQLEEHLHIKQQLEKELNVLQENVSHQEIELKELKELNELKNRQDQQLAEEKNLMENHVIVEQLKTSNKNSEKLFQEEIASLQKEIEAFNLVKMEKVQVERSLREESSRLIKENKSLQRRINSEKELREEIVKLQLELNVLRPSSQDKETLEDVCMQRDALKDQLSSLSQEVEEKSQEIIQHTQSLKEMTQMNQEKQSLLEKEIQDLQEQLIQNKDQVIQKNEQLEKFLQSANDHDTLQKQGESNEEIQVLTSKLKTMDQENEDLKSKNLMLVEKCESLTKENEMQLETSKMEKVKLETEYSLYKAAVAKKIQDSMETSMLKTRDVELQLDEQQKLVTHLREKEESENIRYMERIKGLIFEKEQLVIEKEQLTEQLQVEKNQRRQSASKLTSAEILLAQFYMEKEKSALITSTTTTMETNRDTTDTLKEDTFKKEEGILMEEKEKKGTLSKQEEAQDTLFGNLHLLQEKNNELTNQLEIRIHHEKELEEELDLANQKIMQFNEMEKLLARVQKENENHEKRVIDIERRLTQATLHQNEQDENDRNDEEKNCSLQQDTEKQQMETTTHTNIKNTHPNPLHTKSSNNALLLFQENQELKTILTNMEKEKNSLMEDVRRLENDKQFIKQEYEEVLGSGEVLMQKFVELEQRLELKESGQETELLKEKIQDLEEQVSLQKTEWFALNSQLSEENDRIGAELCEMKMKWAEYQSNC